MGNLIKIAASIAFAALLSACASSGTKIEQGDVDQIEIGTTTKSQMLQTFGAPLSQTFNSDGKLMMTWFYVFVGPFGTGMEQQNLTVLFDQGEKVEKFSITNSDTNGPRLGY
ncbi:outer membrane protein assembly factor BamE [Pseudomonas sp. AOB-7]|uniref:outer membrane protein assembly factor BamE n=1 Tax=Pseudomonas sp. AOB-7 TaxID=2482750 RepID=UPI000EFB2E6F|nr:outer membrane protein assembly factor BamE [Pseudomonas sp. AOB-7]RMH85190.1 outer membrane protein assembly factor BamE [Pseudomonas sp. AOB-7]